MATSSNSTTVPKISSKKLLPKQNINEGFIDAVDELHVAKNMFECAYLAVDGASLERSAVNAIQSVMWRAQQTLEAGIAKVEAIQERSREVES